MSATSLSRAPQQLPPSPEVYTGREEPLARLDMLFYGAAGKSICLSGPPGIGKTTFASKWLRMHADEFPDGQFYVDLRGNSRSGSKRPQEVREQLIQEFGAAVPSEPWEQRQLWHSLTEGLRGAVLLDNALDIAQVRPLLPGPGGGLKVIITSRHKIADPTRDCIISHELGPLDAETALETFQRGLGRKGRRRVAREQRAVRQVMSSCAGVPLKICLASALVTTFTSKQSIAALAEALTEASHSNGGLRSEGVIERNDALRALLDGAYRSLPEDVARSYRLLALLPIADFDEPVMAALCGESLDKAAETLDALVEMYLVEDSGQSRYRFHDLVFQHARRQAEYQETPTERRIARWRFFDWCLATLSGAEASLCPGRRILRRDYEALQSGPLPFTDAEEAFDWLKKRSGWLMETLRAVAADGDRHRTAWQMADAMWPIFVRLRPYNSWIEAHEIGLHGAVAAGDYDGIIRMRTSGGIGLQNAGRLDEAAEWFADALALARRHHYKWDEAQALHGIGQSDWLANRLDSAKESLIGALALRDDLGDRRGKALTRIILGDIARRSGQFGEAHDLLDQAHADLRAEGDSHDAARAIAFLGMTWADSGDIEAARRHLLQAQHTFVTLGSIPWVAYTSEMLGQVEERRGGIAVARSWYEQSLSLYKGMSPRDTKRLEDRICGLDKPEGGDSGSSASC